MMLCRILPDHRPKGLSFGGLMDKSGLNASTLTHHLGLMDRGRILRRRQKGRETWITLDKGRLDTGRLARVVRSVGIPG